MTKLNRIGYKLGLVGLLGVVLAGGMLINQMLSEVAVKDANKHAVAQQSIATNSIEARAELRRMQIAERDVRLAKSPQDIEIAFAAGAEALGASDKDIDAVISKALKPENKDRLQK